MKNKMFYWLTIGVMLVMAITVFLYRDRFLFWLRGYDQSLLHQATAESYEAYVKARKLNPILIFISLGVSVLGIIYSRNMNKRFGTWYFKINEVVAWGISSVLFIMFIFYFIVPGRVF